MFPGNFCKISLEQIIFQTPMAVTGMFRIHISERYFNAWIRDVFLLVYKTLMKETLTYCSFLGLTYLLKVTLSMIPWNAMWKFLLHQQELKGTKPAKVFAISIFTVSKK